MLLLLHTQGNCPVLAATSLNLQSQKDNAQPDNLHGYELNNQSTLPRFY